MGKLEKEVKTRARKQNIKKIILSTIYGAGLVSVAVLAPNVIGALAKLGFVPGRNHAYKVKRSLTRLVEEGLVFWEKTPRGTFARLTSGGKQKVEMLYGGELGVKKPHRWDGKWRIVTYDLKEAKRGLRAKLRNTLTSFGFVKLQHSVWIYPYDCEDLIMLIKADFKIGKDILYLIVEKVENDMWLKRSFGLL